MKVHLIRTIDFTDSHFDNVYNLLSAYPGAIEFIQGSIVTMPSPNGEKIFPKPENFEKQEKFEVSKNNKVSLYISDENVNSKYVKPVFPHKKSYYEWNIFFDVINNYRKSYNVDANDLVFLLTNEYNEKNWFAFIDYTFKNVFVHTDDWPWFFGMNTDIRFPISYEVASWILRSLLYRDQSEIIQNTHPTSLGCVNDFCQNKKEIILKMRTADVCEECLKLIERRDLPPHYLNQLFNIIDGIRSNLMFRKRVGVVFKDSRIRIDFQAKKIYLIDFGNLAVRLYPKEISLYLLFLNYPGGIALNSLTDYHHELLHYYQQVSGRSSLLEMQNTIKLLSNYLEGELNTTISRIKNKFKMELGESMAKNYFIQLLPSGVHGILLNRELVIVGDDLKK
jgi:hypothetical protein